MKRLNALILVAIMCLALFCLASCGDTQGAEPTPAPTAADTPTAEPTSAATPTTTETPFPTGKDGSDESYDAVASLMKVSASDNMPVHEKQGWWDWFCRFTSISDAMKVIDVNADAGGGGSMDEGRGPFSREGNYIDTKSTIEQHEMLKIKTSCWLECQGDSRNMLTALHQLEDGSFEMDERTGAAKIIATAWTWMHNNPSKNADANYIVWAGVHSFVNNEEWAEPFVIKNYPELAVPTYPDGTPAQGYLDGGDRTTPHLAKLYDACAGKDLNGNFIRYDELWLVSESQEHTLALTDPDGKVYYTDDHFHAKDSAAPFWAEYTKFTAKYWIERGVDWFWVDNWNGWDNFGNQPIRKIFGDWTETKFTEYLKENPQIGVTVTDDFNVCDYIREKALELDPDTDVTDLSRANYVWRMEQWLEDPVWMALMSFKAKSNREHNTAFYKGIKEAAQELGIDPNTICVTANDFPYLTYGAYDPEYLDIINTEYNCTYSAITGFTTSGYPPNGYSGHALNLMSNMSKSNTAVLWYYSDYSNNANLSYVLTYEALAYNCTIYSGGTSNGIVGTDTTMSRTNNAIGKLREYFTDRQIYAEIGVVHSVDSEMSTLAPGGFVDDEKNPTTLAYGGWCHAFDELNIPYRSISSYRLEEYAKYCSVLILPEVRSISKAEVENILIPFLDNGGTLVITGENAGIIDSMENNFIPHSSAILEDLANTYSGNGNVIYMEKDMASEYFIFHQKADMETLYELYLNEINSMVEGWYEKGYANKLVSFENLPDSVATTLNYAPSNNHMFVDIVNMQLDVDTDTVTEFEAGVKVKVRLPSSLWGKRLNVKLFTDDSRKIVDLYPDTDFVVENGMVEITLPAFDIYSSIIIREFPQ